MKRQHRVQIKLLMRFNDVWDIESRQKEVTAIRDWVGEQCGWDPELFEFKIHSMGKVMDVWFEREEDAIMCTLRWA